MRSAVSDCRELAQRLQLSADWLEGALPAAAQFGLRLPPALLEAASPDPEDPVLRQFLPRAEELDPTPGFSQDPLQEDRFRQAPALLQKYHGRALLLVSAACPVHCRYCFRRHFPYAQELGDLEAAFAAIAADPQTEEVILSGGDPLMLDNRRLGEILERLEAIPSLRRLRIHSRMPLATPERIDAGLLERLARGRLQPVMVVHCNHPQEIGPAAAQALERLHAAGIHTLNQSVLLRGVNDSAETLCELSRRLFQHQVLPYYLHLLDPVQGAAHFRVEESEARALTTLMQARLPGYLMPRLVREIPGRLAKTPVPPLDEPGK